MVRQRAFGYTDEDVRFLMTPMAVNGEEPVGSMGTDTPLACLSDKPQPLFNYFKQLFAQVTNPPIDPIREEMVMSLVSYIGKERNILAETAMHCHTLKLPHPILTNRDLEKLRRVSQGDFLATTLSALFPVAEGELDWNALWTASAAAHRFPSRMATPSSFFRIGASMRSMRRFPVCSP
jgi:glutamate synthase (NADPH/NADH) large chain